MSNFLATLPKENVNVQVQHATLSWIVDWLLPIIKDTFLPMLVTAINEQVPSLWNNIIAGFMASNKGVIDTGFMNLGVDIGYSAAPSMTAEHLQLFLNGQIFNTATGEVPKFADGLPDVQVGSTKGSALNLAIS
jgi:hypothetical protein